MFRARVAPAWKARQLGIRNILPIDAFAAMMMRENCEKVFFVSFNYSEDAPREMDAFFKRSNKAIIALTVKEILDEQIAKKLA